MGRLSDSVERAPLNFRVLSLSSTLGRVYLKERNNNKKTYIHNH